MGYVVWISSRLEGQFMGYFGKYMRDHGWVAQEESLGNSKCKINKGGHQQSWRSPIPHDRPNSHKLRLNRVSIIIIINNKWELVPVVRG